RVAAVGVDPQHLAVPGRLGGGSRIGTVDVHSGSLTGRDAARRHRVIDQVGLLRLRGGLWLGRRSLGGLFRGLLLDGLLRWLLLGWLLLRGLLLRGLLLGGYGRLLVLSRLVVGVR